MKLYHSPRTRSLRVRWLLEEMQLPYELVETPFRDMLRGKHRTESYLKLHPHGFVPLLQDEDITIFESGAICQYLTEKYPEKGFAPLPGTALRPAYLQWMFYLPGTMEPPAFEILKHSLILPKKLRLDGAKKLAERNYNESLSVLEKVVDGQDYLLGSVFSAADIMIGATLQWLPQYLEHYPALNEYSQRLLSRPAYQKAAES